MNRTRNLGWMRIPLSRIRTVKEPHVHTTVIPTILTKGKNKPPNQTDSDQGTPKVGVPSTTPILRGRMSKDQTEKDDNYKNTNRGTTMLEDPQIVTPVVSDVTYSKIHVMWEDFITNQGNEVKIHYFEKNFVEIIKSREVGPNLNKDLRPKEPWTNLTMYDKDLEQVSKTDDLRVRKNYFL